MTQKEKLANEYVELKKKFDGEDFAANIAQHQIGYLTRTFKVYELQEKIEAVRSAIKAKAKREATEAWFNTEEGKAYKEEHEAELESLKRSEDAILKSALANAREEVKNLLGEAFDITSFGYTSMTIALIEEYSENGKPKGFFGHDFTVNFNTSWTDNMLEWTLNYGTLGSFDLDTDENRIKYLTGLAKFASDREVVPALRDSLHKMVFAIRNISREYYRLERELKEPKEVA